ncbi:MAG: hypothetical protein N2112_04065 [Gemmataceae bacterium]|jgi:hypothetical protein|nr:hypothetical protein [Gemmataceae bacterium]
MDPQEPTPDHTLSFVDLITNGLGSLLVLFFILVLIQENLNWSNEPEALPTNSIPTNHPMMILVQLKPDRTPFDQSGQQSIWLFSRSASDLGISSTRGRDIDWGKDYALLLTPEILPRDFQVFLNSSHSVEDISVEIYFEGLKQTALPESVNGQLRIWPPKTIVSDEPIEKKTKP